MIFIINQKDIKKFVKNIFHKYHIENEKNHDTVHVLSVHTSKDDAVAEWIKKRPILKLQKQITSIHSFSKELNNEELNYKKIKNLSSRIIDFRLWY